MINFLQKTNNKQSVSISQRKNTKSNTEQSSLKSYIDTKADDAIGKRFNENDFKNISNDVYSYSEIKEVNSNNIRDIKDEKTYNLKGKSMDESYISSTLEKKSFHDMNEYASDNFLRSKDNSFSDISILNPGETIFLEARQIGASERAHEEAKNLSRDTQKTAAVDFDEIYNYIEKRILEEMKN